MLSQQPNCIICKKPATQWLRQGQIALCEEHFARTHEWVCPKCQGVITAFDAEDDWMPRPCTTCHSRELSEKLSGDNLATLAEYRKTDQKINAIKAIREYLGLSIREAMQWGDAYFAGVLDEVTECKQTNK